jgi:hypothetical protein
LKLSSQPGRALTHVSQTIAMRDHASIEARPVIVDGQHRALTGAGEPDRRVFRFRVPGHVRKSLSRQLHDLVRSTGE